MSTRHWSVFMYILGGVAILYYLHRLYHVDPGMHGANFMPCPLHWTTGLKCPGCGSQRALHQLMHGQVASAFYWNALMVVSLPYLMLGLLPKKPQWLAPLYTARFVAWIVLTAILGYAIIRNTGFYPLY